MHIIVPTWVMGIMGTTGARIFYYEIFHAMNFTNLWDGNRFATAQYNYS